MSRKIHQSPAPHAWRTTEADAAAIAAGRHGDPFAILGPHRLDDVLIIRAFVPGAETVAAAAASGDWRLKLEPNGDSGLFEGRLPGAWSRHDAYRLSAQRGSERWSWDDPYRFGPTWGPIDDHLLVAGDHRRLWEKLGAHPTEHEGARGVRFAVWAPRAARVSVTGGFNAWDGRRHPMRKRIDSGVWELFIPDLAQGEAYKFEIIARDGRLLPLKADPFGFAAEMRPSTASVVQGPPRFNWSDRDWMDRRAEGQARRAAISILEVHLGSWRRNPEGGFLTYDELADQLIPYARDQGFTHLELLPVTEHPLDESWGYQPIGLFAPTRRFGPPEAFARFIDRAHGAGLGVIMDWAPAHFPTDAHGLALFDGEPLYECADPRRGFHPDWNTAIFDFGRREVSNILLANALYWFEAFHIDALRVDAVASMLYLDYSRRPGEWLPNAEGGRENRDAEAFLKRLNVLVHGSEPGALTMAEESTSWPGVSLPVHDGGLGFDFKWNMGWMNDTLAYVSEDPVHRPWKHDRITFGLTYAHAENFILPLSHDEVVHGKRSILGRMPGDDWRRLAGLRGYFGFMWGYPGKKLLFMGQEFGQAHEWNSGAALDWELARNPGHAGVARAVADLNRLYRTLPALHARDCEPEGFRWIVVDDKDQSVFAWLRTAGPEEPPVAVVCNFTPVTRSGYRIGLPFAGRWIEIFNSDAAIYGGSNQGNLGSVMSEETPWRGFPASAAITVPPLACLYLQYRPSPAGVS